MHGTTIKIKAERIFMKFDIGGFYGKICLTI